MSSKYANIFWGKHGEKRLIFPGYSTPGTANLSISPKTSPILLIFKTLIHFSRIPSGKKIPFGNNFFSWNLTICTPNHTRFGNPWVPSCPSGSTCRIPVWGEVGLIVLRATYRAPPSQAYGKVSLWRVRGQNNNQPPGKPLFFIDAVLEFVYFLNRRHHGLWISQFPGDGPGLVKILISGVFPTHDNFHLRHGQVQLKLVG